MACGVSAAAAGNGGNISANRSALMALAKSNIKRLAWRWQQNNMARHRRHIGISIRRQQAWQPAWQRHRRNIMA